MTSGALIGVCIGIAFMFWVITDWWAHLPNRKSKKKPVVYSTSEFWDPQYLTDGYNRRNVDARPVDE